MKIEVGRTWTAVGVDGCKGGWVYVTIDPDWAFTVAKVGSLPELVNACGNHDVVCIDIPIGLPETADRRLCDIQARQLLRSSSSVFPVPVRQALIAVSYSEAKRINKGVSGRSLSQQTFGIMPKIKEADDLLRISDKARRLLVEVHPEVCFRALAGKRMDKRKTTTDGFLQRMQVLKAVCPMAADELQCIRNTHRALASNAIRDDLVDAMVAALTATAGDLKALPSGAPPVDNVGLPMRIAYAT